MYQSFKYYMNRLGVGSMPFSPARNEDLVMVDPYTAAGVHAAPSAVGVDQPPPYDAPMLGNKRAPSPFNVNAMGAQYPAGPASYPISSPGPYPPPYLTGVPGTTGMSYYPPYPPPGAPGIPPPPFGAPAALNAASANFRPVKPSKWKKYVSYCVTILLVILLIVLVMTSKPHRSSKLSRSDHYNDFTYNNKYGDNKEADENSDWQRN